MIQVYRITKTTYGTDLSGTGAFLYGGRWNDPGIHMLYTADSVALATLESLAHLRQGISARDFVLVTLALPSGPYPSVEEYMHLPSDWTQPPPYSEATKAVGRSSWFQEHLAVRAPSVVTRKDDNYLVNPGHALMKEVAVLSVEPYDFDQRLLV